MKFSRHIPSKGMLDLIPHNCTHIKVFTTDTGLRIASSVDDGKLHLSISHESRYPTWDEIKEIRYTLAPNEITMGILFPPIEQYVNIHPNCFHLFEI